MTPNRQPISTRQPPVWVEYDAPKGRQRRHFLDPRAARRFYASMLQQGRKPKVLAG